MRQQSIAQEIEELRRANAQDRTDIQRLWRLVGRGMQAAAQPPWGLSGTTVITECLGCQIPGNPVLTVIKTGSTTRPDNFPVYEAFEYLAANGPVTLPLTAFFPDNFGPGQYVYRWGATLGGFTLSTPSGISYRDITLTLQCVKFPSLSPTATILLQVYRVSDGLLGGSLSRNVSRVSCDPLLLQSDNYSYSEPGSGSTVTYRYEFTE